jgi:hypothetical protein
MTSCDYKSMMMGSSAVLVFYGRSSASPPTLGLPGSDDDGDGLDKVLIRLCTRCSSLLTVYFGTPSMFITLWFGFDYGTNPPLGTLII